MTDGRRSAIHKDVTMCCNAKRVKSTLTVKLIEAFTAHCNFEVVLCTDRRLKIDVSQISTDYGSHCRTSAKGFIRGENRARAEPILYCTITDNETLCVGHRQRRWKFLLFIRFAHSRGPLGLTNRAQFLVLVEGQNLLSLSGIYF